MGRWLGVDHGKKRVGVAVGSTEDGIALPVTVLQAQPESQLPGQIQALAAEYDCQGVVVGWPVNMDDTEGRQGQITRQFAAHLAEVTGLDVRMWDERLSSFHADKALAGMMTRKKRKARQDAVAAANILGEFFAGNGPTDALRPADIDKNNAE